eukprot:10090546-Alexandrium_andersonii.AAC.1
MSEGDRAANGAMLQSSIGCHADVHSRLLRHSQPVCSCVCERHRKSQQRSNQSFLFAHGLAVIADALSSQSARAKW